MQIMRCRQRPKNYLEEVFLNCTIIVYHFEYSEKNTTIIIKAKIIYVYKLFWLIYPNKLSEVALGWLIVKTVYKY